MLKQADPGDPEIWHELGDAFQHGHGVERDVPKAEEWFRKSGNAGHAPSMVRLGLLLTQGERTPEEVRESVDWFRRAAELGDARGMTWMGFAYRQGTGVPVDERTAADWFIKAYAAGSRSASELAGRLLAHKLENHPEAVKWLRTAVEDGDDSAYYNLALIHEHRNSPEYDPEEAFRCWSHVAERPKGNLRIVAMFILARWCRDGIGTERSRDEAKRWLDRILAVAPKDKSDYRDAAKLRREIDDDLF
jgi:TPR repeat protein